jgi:hypothetical protein
LTGAVTGIVVLAQRSALGTGDNPCNLDTNQCPPEQKDAADAYNGLRPISTIALASGAALSATGIVLLLTLPKSREKVDFRVAPSSVSITAAF